VERTQEETVSWAVHRETMFNDLCCIPSFAVYLFRSHNVTTDLEPASTAHASWRLASSSTPLFTLRKRTARPRTGAMRMPSRSAPRARGK